MEPGWHSECQADRVCGVLLVPPRSGQGFRGEGSWAGLGPPTAVCRRKRPGDQGMMGQLPTAPLLSCGLCRFSFCFGGAGPGPVGQGSRRQPRIVCLAQWFPCGGLGCLVWGPSAPQGDRCSQVSGQGRPSLQLSPHPLHPQPVPPSSCTPLSRLPVPLHGQAFVPAEPLPSPSAFPSAPLGCSLGSPGSPCPAQLSAHPRAAQDHLLVGRSLGQPALWGPPGRAGRLGGSWGFGAVSSPGG